MAVIRPFRAIHYDQERVDPAAVLAPLAGSASPRDLRDLVEREPRNAVRVLVPDPDGDEAPEQAARRARFFIADWLRAGVLVQEDEPALYAVRLGVTDPDEAESSAVVGFFGCIDPTPGRGGSVRCTAAADADSVAVAPAVVLYEDAEGRCERTLESEIDRDPDLRARLGGLDVEMFVIDDETTCARLQTQLEPQDLVRLGGPAPSTPFTAFLLPAAAQVRTAPPHRVVRLREHFDRAAFEQRASTFFEMRGLRDPSAWAVDLAEAAPGAILLVDPGVPLLLEPKETAAWGDVALLTAAAARKSAAALLHHLVLGELLGTDAVEASTAVCDAQEVWTGALEAAPDNIRCIGFLMGPPSAEHVHRAALEGVSLPDASGQLVPPLPGGLVLDPL